MDTAKIDEWTVDECRAWLAGRQGWTETTPSMLDGQAVPLGSEWHRPTPNGSPGSLTWCIHPIHATLDEAAKLPEGYSFDIVAVDGHMIRARAFDSRGTTILGVCQADTELLVRFRLRVKVESANQS